MPQIQNVHHLSIAVAELIVKRSHSPRTLESYLICLLILGRKHRVRGNMSYDRFYRLISEAFSASQVAFDQKWLQMPIDAEMTAGFEAWESTLIRQIVDLHEMKEDGRLASKTRYEGLDSPRGNRWINFDPCSYLESGCDHACRTPCEPEHEPELELSAASLEVEVPAPTATHVTAHANGNGNGSTVKRSGEDTFSWERFREFILSGQMRE